MKFQFFFPFLVAGILLSGMACGQPQKHHENSLFPSRIKKILLIEPVPGIPVPKEENNDLLSFKNVFEVAGIPYTGVTTEKMKTVNLRDYDIIVLPGAAAKILTPDMIEQAAAAVKEGSGILFDGNSAVDQAFHVTLRPLAQGVRTIHDSFFYGKTLFWKDTVEIFGADTLGTNFTSVAVDDSTRMPVVITGTLGKGKFISFANLFDPFTNKGYSTYPYLIELIGRIFGNITPVRRLGSEMYFDPGLYQYPLKYDELAQRWHRQMIKKIYAGGWYYDDENVNYHKLLKACHANGIQVYCWLELPMVSEKFWNDHPGWREKTATLRDAHVDWRELMNLADPACRKQVFVEIGKMLNQYDWDGVNLAELYFETVGDGRQMQEDFTPMNKTIREEFKQKSGFDPYLLFNPSSKHYWKGNDTEWKSFLDYRRELLYRLKIDFVGFITEISNHKTNFEPMVTAIDATLKPEIVDYIGEDTRNTLEIYRKFPITLQIEDPGICWGSTPDRYEKMGRYFRKFVTDEHRLVFDCNVVSSHENGDGGFPNEKPSGEEIRQIAYNMLLSGSRPAFYAEDEFASGDYDNINVVLARETRLETVNDSTWSILAPNTVMVRTGLPDRKLYLDHEVWQATDSDQVIIPAGKHLLVFSPAKESDAAFRLMFISGELNSATFSEKIMEFSYQEYKTGCYVIVNKKPTAVFIDGKQTSTGVLENGPDSYTVKLPGNSHTARIVAP